MSIAPVYKWLSALCLLGVLSIASSQDVALSIEDDFDNPDREVNDDFDQYRSFDHHIPLEIFNDRIGLQTQPGTTEEQVLEIAKATDLQLNESYYRGIYHFDTSEPMSRKSLTSLTRQLETD